MSKVYPVFKFKNPEELEQDKLKKMIADLHSKKYTTTTINCLVETTYVKSVSELIEAVKDEITSLNEVMDQSEIKEEFGFSERSAKAYVKKLEKFLDDNMN